MNPDNSRKKNFREDNFTEELLYASSGEQLWAPLIEKAVAKLYGSYENIAGGASYDGIIFQS